MSGSTEFRRPSRQLTFHQEIRDAVAARERLRLVVGPKAATSDYVSQEWRTALELAKCVTPIVRLNDQPELPLTIEQLSVMVGDVRSVQSNAPFARELPATEVQHAAGLEMPLLGRPVLV